jgi:uncharacterized protein YabN with tetrapyrrole methylase and pyrophosphatase domain
MCGSLVVVGTGLALASQLTPEAREAIASADIVFANVGYELNEQWLRGLNANLVSLQSYYGQGRSRSEAYDAMTEAILAAVRKGRLVCAAFYGHPGVYVWPSHEAIRRARTEGFKARMLPGVSAEDCLVADLGVDPARTGWQSYEATDFFIHARSVDTTASLVLWQIGVVGDLSLRELTVNRGRLQALTQVLLEHYPCEHEVTVYEASTLPVVAAKLQRLHIVDLPDAAVSQQSTLYIPPLSKPRMDVRRLAMLDIAETTPR